LKDIEAMQRYIQAFDTNLPQLNDYDFWEKLFNGTEWMKSKFPDSPFADLAEEYERMLFKIACMRHEIIQEGGKNIDESRTKV